MSVYQGDLQNSFGTKPLGQSKLQKPFDMKNELSKIDYWNYMPAMGRVRAVKYPSPQEIAKGAREFELEIAKHAANMRQEAIQRSALARQLAQQKTAELIRQTRLYNERLANSAQQKALSNVRSFLVKNGKITNFFGQ